MTQRPTYEAPALVEIGTLHELTMTLIQKVGAQTDALTGLTGLTGNISIIVP